MKKALLLLLVIVLASVSLIGCKKEAEKVTLNVMGYGDNSNQEGISWKRMVTEFMEANPGVEIVDELLYDEAYHQKVTARLAAGDAPHMAYMGADARWGAPWQEANQQIDNRPYIDASVFDMNLIPEMGPNGEVYYLPLGTSNITTVLYMNEPLVESLGFSEPQSYDDLVAMVPAATEAGLQVVSIDGADGWAWGSCLLSALIARTSGDPMWVSKAVNGENSFTDDAMVDALGIIESMVNDGVIDSKSVLVDYGANISTFSNEQALFFVQGQWAAGGVENPDVRDNMKLLAWPNVPGEKPGVAGSVAAAWQVGYGVTQAAVDAGVDSVAADFLAYVNREEEATQRLRDGAIVAPVIKGYTTPADL
ncbi:MAG: extracellular solute-binding protein, partial [Spirochaetaceae bacterium]|nr:extracellular solute-binding protein [Spirochaetaceae bacterium]